MTHQIVSYTRVSANVDLASRIRALGLLLNNGLSHPRYDAQEELAVRERFSSEGKMVKRSIDVSWKDMQIISTYVFSDKAAALAYVTDPVIANKIVCMAEAGYTVTIEGLE